MNHQNSEILSEREKITSYLSSIWDDMKNGDIFNQISKNPGSPDFLSDSLKTVDDLLAQNNLDEALRIIVDVIHYEPKNPVVINAYGSLLLQKGDIGNALAQYSSSIVFAPEYTAGFINLAAVYSYLGYIGIAKEFAKVAIDREPNQVDALRILANIAIESGDVEECTSRFLQILQLIPNDEEALKFITANIPDDISQLIILGDEAFREQCWNKAIDYYSYAVASLPAIHPIPTEINQKIQLARKQTATSEKKNESENSECSM
jgi:tetratricopeptide (TPR) repeat protein